MLAKVISLFFLVHCMHCAPKDDLQLTACALEDFQCTSDLTENFLEKTASGFAALDIKPFDPLIIDSFNANIIDGVLAQFKNINITGLRKQKVTQLKYDTVAKSTVYAVNVDVNLVSDIELEYEETKKKYSGTYTAGGKAAIQATYDYQFKTDDKGVEHFQSGPETLTCEFITYHAESNKEFINALENDPHAQKIYQENRASVETAAKRNVCDILKVAYAVILNIFRQVERAYPASAFISNV